MIPSGELKSESAIIGKRAGADEAPGRAQTMGGHIAVAEGIRQMWLAPELTQIGTSSVGLDNRVTSRHRVPVCQIMRHKAPAC